MSSFHNSIKKTTLGIVEMVIEFIKKIACKSISFQKCIYGWGEVWGKVKNQNNIFKKNDNNCPFRSEFNNENIFLV